MPRPQSSSARRRDYRRRDDGECRCLAGTCGFAVYILIRACMDAFFDHAQEDNANGTWSPVDTFGIFILLMFFLCLCAGIMTSTNSADNGDRDRYQQRGASSSDIEDQRALRQPLLSNDNNEQRSAEIQSELDWYSRARELMENSDGAITSFTEALRLVEEQDEQGKNGEEKVQSLESKEDYNVENENNASLDSQPVASLQEPCPNEKEEKKAEKNGSSDNKSALSPEESDVEVKEERAELATHP